MKTAIQEMIDWTLRNAFSLKGEDGTSYIAIDHEDMRLKFDEWLELERKQIVDAANENLIVAKGEIYEFVEASLCCCVCDMSRINCKSVKCSPSLRKDGKNGAFKLKNE